MDVYTQVSIRTLKAIHNATHPAARPGREHAANDITATVLRVRPGEDAGDVSRKKLLDALAAEAQQEDQG